MVSTKNAPRRGIRPATPPKTLRRPARGSAHRAEPVPDLRESFAALKGLLVKHARHLMVVTDAPDEYTLNTRKRGASGEPMLFGSAQMRTSHVSYQLMPMQLDPALAAALTPGLRKHLQGKRGFSFTTLDPAVLEELDLLTRAAMASFTRKGFA